jgi:hypothetical protein
MAGQPPFAVHISLTVNPESVYWDLAERLLMFDIFTGETITHPVILFFSNARKYNETLYRLYVACQ